MQQGTNSLINGAERKRLEAVVETLAAVGSRGETVAEVAHDARNMVTALGLYCDLLEEPGVLANPFAHYGSELRLVAAASSKLVEKLVALDGQRVRDMRGNAKSVSENDRPRPAAMNNDWQIGWEATQNTPITSFAVELLANHNLLAALAGPSITLTVDVDGGARAVWMTGEDLTRVLVNLVKNAAEALPAGGRIQIRLREVPASAGALDAMVLTVEDTGPGVPDELLDKVFESGFTTRGAQSSAASSRAVSHRGLGLAITRSIVESAGGRILASNRIEGGARFEIDLPVRKPYRK
jgi:signal transduction histidine kinase